MSGYKPFPPVHGRRSYSAASAQRQTKMRLLEAQVLLRRAIGNELTDRQRDCVQLYYGERLTMQEIADELHLTRGTVCKHLQKASARLSHGRAFAVGTVQLDADRWVMNTTASLKRATDCTAPITSRAACCTTAGRNRAT